MKRPMRDQRREQALEAVGYIIWCTNPQALQPGLFDPKSTVRRMRHEKRLPTLDRLLGMPWTRKAG